MRTLTSARRSAVVSVLAFLLVVAGAQAAHACSCLIGDPRDALHRSDGAFVGTLVERTEVDEQTSIFTFEVETAVKGTIGADDRRALELERRLVRIGGRDRTADRPAAGDRRGRSVDLQPVFADRPGGPAERGRAAPRARRRRAGAVRGRRQPGREPADGARPHGQDARVRPGRRLRARRGCLPRRDTGPRGCHAGTPGAAGGARSAVARRGEDDHARRDDDVPGSRTRSA